MKKLLVILLILSIVMTLAACDGISKISDDEIKTVRNVAYDGSELTITLGENKSTGYKWDYEIFGECIKPSINRSFKLTGSKGDAMGEASIGFEGISEGSAVIVFTTPNDWDGTGEGDGYTVTVDVAADGAIVSAQGKDGANAPEPTPDPIPEETEKISIAIDELAEGTYIGSMPGDEYSNSDETKSMVTTVMPADIEVTIENGQITIYCNAKTTAYGTIDGEETPQSPEGSLMISGSLPLQQDGDTVTAEGGIATLGEMLQFNFDGSTFLNWELVEREGDKMFDCAVRIAMEKGVPVATIIASRASTTRTTTVQLALK